VAIDVVARIVKAGAAHGRDISLGMVARYC